ncbi:peptidylprolyl isomerase [Plasticicumulans sp.]|uniref:peptidylprolyl isomerase n=1 Tax=Plasticicumulans sp. TaxID=2307179 RepID=UPI00394ED08E
MKSHPSALRAAIAAAGCALLLPLAAQAQNIAIVNGKPVPKQRVDNLMTQAAKAGQKVGPEMETQAKDQVVLREIFTQEAERKGLAASADYRAQMELARQSILIRELFDDFRKSHPVAEADAKAEYDKFKAQAAGTEYHARHILVESEDQAKALIAQLKAGASFEELAKKNSKDPGSGEQGGDLDFAKADAYVPEFSQAMVKLKKGEITETPVKTQFGWHVIKLEDTREAQFPSFDDVKAQIVQRLEQIKLQQYQEDLRKAAKTDYKFAQQ